MRLRTFYTITILLPAVALAAVAPFAGRPVQIEPPVGPGVTQVWLYPRFAIRELASYALVAAWLLWQFRSRTSLSSLPLSLKTFSCCVVAPSRSQRGSTLPSRG